MVSPSRPDYGIDAPGVVRNLAIGGGALLAVAGAAFAGLLPSALALGPIGIDLPFSALAMGIGFGGAAAWLYFGSRYGKLDEREKLLRHVAFRGDEQVLDVGCGRGLILVGAAHALTTGRAVGIDIWQTADVSGNSAQAPLENARLEGVAERVAVQTCDMRSMPFPDGAFDVVVSRAAVHNLYRVGERQAAIREIARVLRPGGRAVIADIRHIGEYIAAFAAHGCTARRVRSGFWEFVLSIATIGRMCPNTLVVDKRA